MAELANRMRLEADFARELSRLSSRHRRELLALLGDPPNPANVPPEFWVRVEKEHRETLTLALAFLFMAAGSQHADILLPPDLRTVATDSLRDDAQAWAETRAASASSEYVRTSRNRVAKLPRRWYGPDFVAQGPALLIIGDVKAPGSGQIQSDLLDIFGPLRDANIAATETTGAATAGTNDATGRARDFGVKVTVTWFTERDSRVCPICRPLDGLGMELWEPALTAAGAPASAIDMIALNGGPPAHVNCRCWLESKVVRRPIEESFDPSKHPRDPGGEHGGEFVTKDGGIDDGQTAKNKARQFVPSEDYEAAADGRAESSSDAAYATAMSTELYRDLDDRATFIVEDYTHNEGGDRNAEEMNAALRNGDTLTPEEDAYVREFNNLIDAYGISGIKTFRGISISRKEFDGAMESFELAAESGKPITFNGFSSTTTVPRVAIDFSERGVGGDDYKAVIFEIEARRGLPIERFSRFEDENEVVLRHRARFVVNSVHRNSAVQSNDPRAHAYPVEWLVKLSEIEPLAESTTPENRILESAPSDTRAMRFVGRLQDIEFT